jgi:hypothetical protein
VYSRRKKIAAADGFCLAGGRINDLPDDDDGGAESFYRVGVIITRIHVFALLGVIECSTLCGCESPLGERSVIPERARKYTYASQNSHLRFAE